MPPIVTYLIPLSPPVVTYPIPLSFSSCSLSDSLILLLSLSNSLQQHSLFPIHFHRDMGGRGRKLRLFPHCLTGAALLLYTVYLLLPPHSSNIIPKQHASLNSSQQYMMLTTERQEIPKIQLRVSGFSAIF